MSESSKTTVYLDANDYRRLKALAKSKGSTAAALVREAVAVYVARRQPRIRPSSIGAGRSRRGDLSARADELLVGMGRDE
jgi:predicted transcriptional regulator